MKKLLPILFCLLCGCTAQDRDLSREMCFDEVTYVTSFPRIVELQGGQRLEPDLMGSLDLLICDSLMIVSTRNSKGYLSLLSLPDLTLQGRYLLGGNGPEEVLFPPWINNASIRNEDGQLCAYLTDSQKGRILKINVSRTLRDKKLHIASVCDTLPPLLLNAVYIDEQSYLCRILASDQTRQNRLLVRNGKQESPEYLERLNDIQVTPNGMNHNLLSTQNKYSQKHDMLVEVPVSLNYINMYRPDGSVRQTVCLGNEVSRIGELDRLERWEQPYTFAASQIYDRFWGVLYSEETPKSFQLKRKNLPRIYLFDWQGAPVAELKLPNQATGFDIDFRNGHLYTIDHKTEELFRYDIGNFLTNHNF